MTSYATRIRALFDDIDRTPWGPEEPALVAEAVALAQESGDERLEYEARLRQTSSANMAGLVRVVPGSPRRRPRALSRGAGARR